MRKPKVLNREKESHLVELFRRGSNADIPFYKVLNDGTASPRCRSMHSVIILLPSESQGVRK